jgi:hypothetical protein
MFAPGYIVVESPDVQRRYICMVAGILFLVVVQKFTSQVICPAYSTHHKAG